MDTGIPGRMGGPEPGVSVAATVDNLVERLATEGHIWAPRLARCIGTHPSTVLRWILHGVKLADGRTHKLEAVRVGGRWATSEAAYRRFVEAQQHVGPVPVAAPRTPAARQAASEAAERELAAAGW